MILQNHRAPEAERVLPRFITCPALIGNGSVWDRDPVKSCRPRKSGQYLDQKNPSKQEGHWFATNPQESSTSTRLFVDYKAKKGLFGSSGVTCITQAIWLPSINSCLNQKTSSSTGLKITSMQKLPQPLILLDMVLSEIFFFSNQEPKVMFISCDS